jgi:hypothetical protein
VLVGDIMRFGDVALQVIQFPFCPARPLGRS